jgi:phosphoglycolate phosphatase-like HAD superfamily hydrolase
MPVRAIAFDFNGTPPTTSRCWRDLRRAVAEHGKPLSAQEYFDHLAGHSDSEIVHRWLGSSHVDEQAVIEERIRRYRACP